MTLRERVDQRLQERAGTERDRPEVTFAELHASLSRFTGPVVLHFHDGRVCTGVIDGVIPFRVIDSGRV